MKVRSILSTENIAIIEINEPLVAFEGVSSIMSVMVFNKMKLEIINSIWILNKPELLIRHGKNPIKLGDIISNRT